MPSPQTPDAPEKVMVSPGPGRKVPLPLPGTGVLIPAEGKAVVMTLAVQRLVRSGDLVVAKAGTTAPAPTPAAATTKTDVKEG